MAGSGCWRAARSAIGLEFPVRASRLAPGNVRHRARRTAVAKNVIARIERRREQLPAKDAWPIRKRRAATEVENGDKKRGCDTGDAGKTNHSVARSMLRLRRRGVSPAAHR